MVSKDGMEVAASDVLSYQCSKQTDFSKAGLQSALKEDFKLASLGVCATHKYIFAHSPFLHSIIRHAFVGQIPSLLSGPSMIRIGGPHARTRNMILTHNCGAKARCACITWKATTRIKTKPCLLIRLQFGPTIRRKKLMLVTKIVLQQHISLAIPCVSLHHVITYCL